MPTYSWAALVRVFFDGAYDVLLDWLEREHLELTEVGIQHSIIQIAWCFGVAGFHKRYESFAAVLDYAFFTERAKLRPGTIRRLAQLADMVLQEAPERAEGMQQPDLIRSTLTDPNVRRLISSGSPFDLKLFQDVRTALQTLEWPHAVSAVPDDSSAFAVDISLEAHVDKKVGIIIAGRGDEVRIGLPKEEAKSSDGGELALAKRLLSSRGWRTIAVSGAEWAKADTLEKQKAFLMQTVSKASDGDSKQQSL